MTAGGDVTLLPRPDDVPDVEETGATLRTTPGSRPRRSSGDRRPAVADDTGLEVEALGGAPGVFSARYAGEGATYADNVRKLLLALRDLPTPTRRRGLFRTVALAAFPDGHELVAEGSVSGTISLEPRGSAGFGYDPVFVPDEGDGRTFAEMSAAEKHACSHRGRAFDALAQRLRGVARSA